MKATAVMRDGNLLRIPGPQFLGRKLMQKLNATNRPAITEPEGRMNQ